MKYYWLTNLKSPVDDIDGNFLNALADYRIGPPRVAVEQARHNSLETMVAAGVFGVYTTPEAILKPTVRMMLGINCTNLDRETELGNG